MVAKDTDTRLYLACVVLDMFVLLIGFALANIIVIGNVMGQPTKPHGLVMFAMIAPVYLVLAVHAGGYRTQVLSRRFDSITRALRSLLQAAFLTLLIIFLGRISLLLSRLTFGIGLALSASGLLAVRLAIHPLARRSMGRGGHTITVIRDGAAYDAPPDAVVLDARAVGLDPASLDEAGVQQIRNATEAAERVILACPADRLEAWAGLFRRLGIPAEALVPKLLKSEAGGMDSYDGQPTIAVSTGVGKGGEKIAGHMVDMFLAAGAIILFSPVLLLAAAASFCVMAVLWPFALYPLALRLLSPRPVQWQLGEGVSPPSMSLLFCAYNEGLVMAEKIANLERLKARYPDLEILAFDDGSADDTATQLAARPDLLTLVRGGGRSGKAHGMKLLAARARGDILVFTDANVILQEDAMEHLARYYQDQDVGGVVGSLRYLGDGESSTAAVGSLYWRIEEYLKDLESRSGNVMGADGSIFSIRKALYPDFPDTVLDDLTVSMAVVFAGKRLVKARDVVAYERLVAVRQEEYRRKVRISARAWHTHCYLLPELRRMTLVDSFKYVSRKMIRWFGGVYLMIGAVAVAMLAWLLHPAAAVALIAGTLALLAIGIRMRGGPLAALADIVLAYFATLQGVFQAMSGKTFAVWNPAKSR